MSNNEADFMYNWIRKHGGRVKMDDVTTNETPICEYSGLPGVESYNNSGNDNKNNKDNEMDNNNTIQSNEYRSKGTSTK